MPRRRPDLVPVAIHRFGGVASFSDLTRFVTRRQVRHAVEDGTVVRARRGVYVLPSLPSQAVAAARARGALCRESAAEAWQLPTLMPPAEVHVAVARGARPRPAPGVRHHWSPPEPAEVAAGRTAPLRTVLDCAAALPFAEALTIADAALHQGLLTSAELVAGAQASPGAGAGRRKRVARCAEAGAASPFESALRATLLDAGVTDFVVQLPVRMGFTARVDLGDPARRIALEADGFAFHAATPGAFTRDCRRYDELVRHDWLVLRFTWEQVMFEPDWVVGMVEDVRRLRKPAPTSPRVPSRPTFQRDRATSGEVVAG